MVNGEITNVLIIPFNCLGKKNFIFIPFHCHDPYFSKITFDFTIRLLIVLLISKQPLLLPPIITFLPTTSSPVAPVQVLPPKSWSFFTPHLFVCKDFGSWSELVASSRPCHASCCSFAKPWIRRWWVLPVGGLWGGENVAGGLGWIFAALTWPWGGGGGAAKSWSFYSAVLRRVFGMWFRFWLIWTVFVDLVSFLDVVEFFLE